MKLGPIEWNPLGFLHEEIKNTRFLLTLIAVLGIGMGGLSAVYLILKGVTIDQAMLAVFTTIIGALIGLVNTAYNAYFKDRQTAESESKATEKAIALASSGQSPVTPEEKGETATAASTSTEATSASGTATQEATASNAPASAGEAKTT